LWGQHRLGLGWKRVCDQTPGSRRSGWGRTAPLPAPQLKNDHQNTFKALWVTSEGESYDYPCHWVPDRLMGYHQVWTTGFTISSLDLEEVKFSISEPPSVIHSTLDDLTRMAYAAGRLKVDHLSLQVSRNTISPK
jgi:hypothetical protein